MLRVQLGYLTLNSGAHSHLRHSAYVTWSDVALWSAHMPASLLNFFGRTHFVRRDWILAHTHTCHSAYVTWSDVELWSAHMPAHLLNFCWHTHLVRRYINTLSSRHVSLRDVTSAVGIFNIEFWRTLTLLWFCLRRVIWGGAPVGTHARTPLQFLLTHTSRETWYKHTILTSRELTWCYECSWDI
jgi:hypothetical protein